MRKFIFASDEDIIRGKTTDIYFIRTLNILKREKLENAIVYAEFTPSSLPSGYKWAVFAGLREVTKLLEGKKITLYALPEGTIFTERDYYGYKIPVMAIEGPYSEFLVLETPILGFLSSASGIASKAARVKLAAGNKPVLSFGARRIHPALAPFNSYYAFIGGCDAVSCIKGAEYLGISPTGTMPHSLMIIFRAFLKDHTLAWIAFDKYVEKNVPRIILVDTFWDEAEEAIRAASLLGEKLWGVRLDTPSSRRGSFEDIIREVKWKLKASGFENVKIVVSGGINEYTIPSLSSAGADAFGVGSSIANAPIVDYAMDIVSVYKENEWIPISKRGKLSGRKQVFRCYDCFVDVVSLEGKVPSCPKCGKPMTLLTQKIIDNGRLIVEPQPAKNVRKFVLEQLSRLSIDKYPWE